MFPDRFTWGAASSAYQIEGGATADGRGPSVWDTFCRRPGAVHDGHTGDEACDHFNRVRGDVDLMREVGLKAYRFSISWPRVLPAGVGAVNAAGLGFYDRLIDALLEAGVEPWITLFHWDMPEALFVRGGWLNRDIARWFAEYASVIADRFADRVSNWITINEPQVYISLGHLEGKHAPGLRLSMSQCLLASHNTLLAHGYAVQAIRARASKHVCIGWAPVGHVTCPATSGAADVAAARSAMFSVSRRDFWNNAWFGDPVCLGKYPADGLRLFESEMPAGYENDLAVIAQPLDFYGVNVYSGGVVRAGANGAAIDVAAPPGAPTTAFRWRIAPEALYWGPKLLHERYRLPVVITENGMSNIDFVDLDGRVRDPQRIDFTRRYLLELSRAMRDGVNVGGYFHWSILDNFEWAEGYKERFGLIHVDYATQQRTLKDSARWYKSVIATRGASLACSADEVQALQPVVRRTGGKVAHTGAPTP